MRTRLFAPPPKLSLSEWADEHRTISPPSPEPGRWRTSRAPYLREIMDACTDPTIPRVVVMKSARVGFTEGVLNNLIGYHIDQQPAAVMVMQPTVEDAKGYSKESLAPMLRDTPRLAGRIRESGRRDSTNTIQLKVFDGGFVVIVGSNSAAGLRRRNIQILVADEIDGYGSSARGRHREGDPLTLARKRLENYWNRKEIDGSTPTLKGASRIESAFELSDQRRYFVPCPHCGYQQTLKWPRFRYDNNDPTTVRYLCGEEDPETHELVGGCGQPITEDRKPWMVERGTWIAQRPGRRIRGYHTWAAYSLFSSWQNIVEQWLEAQGDREKLQVFINTVLGETWREQGDEVPHGTLFARREAYPVEVPAGVAALTAGVDVQGDRFELTIWGWGPGAPPESWVIAHRVLFGDPAQAASWGMVDLAIFREYPHELGGVLKVLATGVDHGGHHSEMVERYCRARRRQRVFAMKGGSEPGTSPVPDLQQVVKKKVVIVGTTAIKDTLNSRLRIPARGPGYVHFPFLEEEYFRQLMAETAKYHYRHGKPVRYYEKVYERNEALDCAVYAYAALLLLGPVRDQLGLMLERLQAAAIGAAGPTLPGGRGRRVRHRGIE